VKSDPNLWHSKWLKYITTIKLNKTLTHFIIFPLNRKKASKVQSKTYGSTQLDLPSTNTTFFFFILFLGVNIRRIKMALENMEFCDGFG
jgi:hypothetical protein